MEGGQAMARRVDNVTMERRVEDALGTRMPEIDLLEFTIDGEMMRVVVDHPDGVDHEVCVAVTRALTDAGLLEQYGAEVWSPGPEPPMRRPDHFRRAVGRRVKIRTGEGEGRASHTGTLESVDDEGITVLTAAGAESIGFGEIRRARVLEEPPG
jgi:ribosome maturation factor RimP